MKLKNIFLILVAVLLGIILGIGLIYLFSKKPKYAVLVFRNGNIYFGKISWFPKPKLSKILFIQVDQSGQASLQRFANAAYFPEDFFYFNPNELIFWSYLKAQSPVVNLIEEKVLPPSAQPPAAQPPAVQEPTTTTPSR